jgi:hypothetical protein
MTSPNPGQENLDSFVRPATPATFYTAITAAPTHAHSNQNPSIIAMPLAAAPAAANSRATSPTKRTCTNEDSDDSNSDDNKNKNAMDFEPKVTYVTTRANRQQHL